MAEPITILGIAAATSQFIDFGLKTVALCKEIRDSNTDQIQFHAELQRSIELLSDLEEGVTLDKCPRELKDTIRDCSSAAKELEDLLLEIQRIAKAKRFGPLRAALRTLKDQRKIEKLQTKLKKCQQRFHAAVSVDTREKVLQILKEQGKTSQTIEHVLLQALQRMQQESSEAYSTTHGKLVLLESGQRASKEAILEGQGKALAESSKAHGLTHNKLAVLGRSHQTLMNAAKKGQGRTRQEMHGRFNDVKSDAEAESLRKSFMESLSYPDMFARYQSIRAPSPTTYEWIFTEEIFTEYWRDPDSIAKDQELRGSFKRWLQSESLVFWVHGKAGSGKSSLMSFIEDDTRTQQALKIWAGDRTLHTFSVFFWRAGSILQKSTVGMLQSLLYQLCQKKPSVVESIVANDPFTKHFVAWNETRLLRTLGWALECYRGECLFFIIDGLDEHEGQYSKLLDALFKLQKISGMKLCLSSRPETAIQDRLSPYSSIRLQDLNYNDIKKFVENEFVGRGESFGYDLVRQVVERAEGIFLWAVLVCRSLISGHDAKDDEGTLQLRLNTIPPGLQEIFRHMFSQLDEVHRSNLSVYFSLLKWTSESDWQPNITVALVTVLLHPRPFDTLQEYTNACSTWMDRIVAQCKGLIDIDDLTDDRSGLFKWALRDISTGDVRCEFLEDDDLTTTRDYTRFRLGWVHRSAYDCVLGDSKDGPIPWLAMVDERALTHKVFAAYIWIMQYTPMILSFKYTHSVFKDLNYRLRILVETGSLFMTDSPEEAYPMLDDFYDTMCTSLLENHEAGRVNSALRAAIHTGNPDIGQNQDSLSADDRLKLANGSPLHLFWYWVTFHLDCYVASRFERMERSACAFSICARIVLMYGQDKRSLIPPGKEKMISLLQRGPKSRRQLAMVVSDYGHAQMITWMGERGEDADTTAWGICNASYYTYNVSADESHHSERWAAIWTVADAWKFSIGTVMGMKCEKPNSFQALPLQLMLPLSSTREYKSRGPLPSVIRIFVIAFPGVCLTSTLMQHRLLLGHEDCRISASFDLSARSTEIVFSHSTSTTGFTGPRFFGASTDYAKCLRIVVDEIREDPGGQLGEDARLLLVESLNKWFVEFWEINDSTDEGQSYDSGILDTRCIDEDDDDGQGSVKSAKMLMTPEAGDHDQENEQDTLS